MEISISVNIWVSEKYEILKGTKNHPKSSVGERKKKIELNIFCRVSK